MLQKNIFRSFTVSFCWTSGVYTLTAFHHYYGARLYGTPWRAHVVLVGGICLLICFLLILLYRRYQKNWLIHIYITIAMLLFGVGIGLFEGLYNHIIKDLLYFSGLNKDSWRTLFPAPAYEIPENFVFECTGMLQFPVAAVQSYYLYQVYKSLKHVSFV